MSRTAVMIDANEAVARVAHRASELIAIYPITPATPMGEWSDAWSAQGRTNLWGSVPRVVEMQSEAGAAGVVHGALQTGSLTTTFTASQGLLLMIPNMYKIAGELTPTVFHVAARSVATAALSIFGDHSDVMAVRQTGFALLASSSVQEAHDLALVAHASALESRVPFLHFFDGFRTSHEVAKIELVDDDALAALLDESRIHEHRRRALTPDRPVLRGTAQNPDTFFQTREAVSPFYAACPDVTQQMMERLAAHTGRSYRLFEYHGAADAERVIVLMGSAAETAHETVDALIAAGEKVGLLKVRLYRPFDARRMVEALPEGVRAVAVLDRTKEPGSVGEPLYLDCAAALDEARRRGWAGPAERPLVIGGRYGLGSKEFTPAMVKAVFDELARPQPRHPFTIGIDDDVSHTSLDVDPDYSIDPDDVVRAVFYGLGADGTVGANKNTIKIIGEEAGRYAQGYFVYDSKKAGAVTVSHLRFGPRPIRSTYLIERANVVACHQPQFLERFDVTETLLPGGVVLLNHYAPPAELWDHLPRRMQARLIERRARLWVIDAAQVARECGLGGHINTVMQAAFFAVSGVLPRDEALAAIRAAIERSYRAKGEETVERNLHAVDAALAHLVEVPLGSKVTAQGDLAPPIAGEAPPFVRDVLGTIIARQGDRLPVSALPVDGTYPTGTARWEKRGLAQEIPVWEPDLCIQCGKCVMVCPHAVIRSKAYPAESNGARPQSFLWAEARDPAWAGSRYTIQVAPDDCTGCAICVDVCPARDKSQARRKAINMAPLAPRRDPERANWDYFLALSEADRRHLEPTSIHQQQVEVPLFEFSGACAGCGETPYLKLLSQLFGDRLLVANATGCSSIYGGNLPTTPWTVDAQGRGPAWSNSLFEDNAEFGFGFRLSLDKQSEYARELVRRLEATIGGELAAALLDAPQRDEADLFEQRQRVAELKQRLASSTEPAARRLLDLADLLVKKSVWIVGGDGWAYDIGFGGLDHVLASGENVNVLVLDTEVYSNTGGQMSKATPRGAVAKFAAAGKQSPKKDLGLIAMTYGNVYVARVAMGARDEHTLRAFLEAEAYDGPSLIIAYSHCIAHGINMATAMQNQRAAVATGQWLLYRYHPERAAAGENPLRLDSRPPKAPVTDYLRRENRFQMLAHTHPDQARAMAAAVQDDVVARRRLYEYLASYAPAGSEAQAAVQAVADASAPSAAASAAADSAAAAPPAAASAATAKAADRNMG